MADSNRKRIGTRQTHRPSREGGGGASSAPSGSASDAQHGTKGAGSTGGAGRRASKTRFIFMTGGVVSSLGKGLTSAALGALLQSCGYTVRLRKFDPYLNIDPGTMNPFEHGEVFVTDDGAETDLDLGHYERFTGVPSRKSDSVTTGRIYARILARERKGDYLGATVQVVPHVTDAIQDCFEHDLEGEDFCIVEIGGTIGDIESLPFLEAVRQFCNRKERETLCIHMTLVPRVTRSGELKTKPTQHSVRELQAAGLRPGLLVVRAAEPLGAEARRKLALFCNLPSDDIIEATDVENIYGLPLLLHERGMDGRVLAHFGLPLPEREEGANGQDEARGGERRAFEEEKDAGGGESPAQHRELAPPAPEGSLAKWREVTSAMQSAEDTVRIAVIGKYTELRDAYLSLNEALIHGGIPHRLRVEAEWLDAEEVQGEGAESLAPYGGILVPGGFGARGSEGKIAAVRFAREREVPYLGICLGLQLALVEIARSLCGMPQAGSSEFNAGADPAIVGLLTEWERGDGGVERRSAADDLGGTMRLGVYEAVLKPESKAARIYGAERIRERHRHRYEINRAHEAAFAEAGLVISGLSPDGHLPEIAELTAHPWFLGVQFHPELTSRPFAPHPLFASFIAAARDRSRLL